MDKVIEEILENKDINNFIYDNAKIKVMIGARRVGKTSALLFDAIRLTKFKKDCNVAIIVGGTYMRKSVEESLVKMLNCLNVKYKKDDANKLFRSNISEYTLNNNNTIYTVSSSEFWHGTRFPKNIYRAYIDEEISYDSINKALDMTRWNNYSVSIASTGINLTKEKLDRLLTGYTFTVYHAKAINLLEEHIDKIKDVLGNEKFKKEFLCEWVDEYFKP